MHDRVQGSLECWHCPKQPEEHPACGCLCHLSRKDFVARATAFVASVGNPSAPACCPWCFNLLAYEISRSSQRVTQIQRAVPQFFETCIRLLVVYSASATDIPRLRERLSSSQRGCPDRPTMHRRRLAAKLTDALEIFLWALFTAVERGLSTGKRALDSAANWHKPHFYKRAGHWPTGLADLFPCGGGVGEGVAALVHWCCVFPGFEPFGVLSSVLCVSRAVSMPYLLKSPARERLVWAILQAVDSGTVPWPAGEPPFCMPRGLAAQRALRGTTETVEQVLELLNTLIGCKDNRTREVVQFVAGHEQLLSDALGPHLSDLERGAAPARGDRACGTVLSEFLDLLCVLLAREQLGGPTPDSLSPAPGPDVTLIRDGVYALHCARFCGNGACGANELSEARLARFPVCEFCQTLRYCSRACQKADWTVGGVVGISHSMICPLLVKLRTTQDALPVDADGTEDYFVRAFEACDFDPRDVDIFHRWSLSCGVAPASRLTLPYSRHV